MPILLKQTAKAAGEPTPRSHGRRVGGDKSVSNPLWAQLATSARRSQTSPKGEAAGAAARDGLKSTGAQLPHLQRVQAAFGRHDLSGVRAHTDPRAAAAADALGAVGYTSGEHVAFAGAPSLRLVAHEAAHVVQQRRGVRPAAVDGSPAAPHERQADMVADTVARGGSAEALLGPPARRGAAVPVVQMQRRTGVRLLGHRRPHYLDTPQLRPPGPRPTLWSRISPEAAARSVMEEEQGRIRIERTPSSSGHQEGGRGEWTVTLVLPVPMRAATADTEAPPSTVWVEFSRPVMADEHGNTRFVAEWMARVMVDPQRPGDAPDVAVGASVLAEVEERLTVGVEVTLTRTHEGAVVPAVAATFGLRLPFFGVRLNETVEFNPEEGGTMLFGVQIPLEGTREGHRSE